ncbi:MAG: hypothetical protein MZV70_52750 [Desulfobacterales bacterium]|nr:hypothetical protein [Desulfobacterales bacterium]
MMGVGAVKAAKATQAFKLEDRAAEVASERIIYKDDKTFYLKDGVWTDSEYKDGAPVTEVKFNSDEFYRLHRRQARPGQVPVGLGQARRRLRGRQLSHRRMRF